MNFWWKGLVRLKISEHFREDLLINYLGLLISSDNKEEFMKYYPSIEPYMLSAVSNSVDTSLLNKVGEIISFRQKCLEIEVKK